MSFSDTFDFLTNNTLSRAELSFEGKIKNIHYGDILVKFGDILDCSFTQIPYISKNAKIGNKVTFLKDGDVIIADTAEDETVGKATEIINVSTPIVSGLHTMACRPKFCFEPRYLGYYINSSCYHNQLFPFMQGVKVTSVGKGNIANTHIRYPSKQEQQKISSMLAIIDNRIEKQQALVESLKLYKRGVSEAIFSKKLHFRNISESRVYTMSEVGTFYNGLSGKSKDDFENGNAQFITYMNVYKNAIGNIKMCENVRISSSETQNKVQYGDVLFSQSSETLEEVGMSSVWLHENTPYLNSFCFGFRFNNFENIYPLYMAYYMRSQEIRHKIMKEGQGATRVNLSAERMKNIKLNIPAFETQQKIGDFLHTLDQQVIACETAIDKLIETRKALLQQMFI